MSQNTTPSKYTYDVLTAGSDELCDMLVEHTQEIWEHYSAFQVNTCASLMQRLLAESDSWDGALIAYNGDTPVAIMAVSGITYSVYHKGLGVHILHAVTLEPGAAAFLYRELKKLCKAQGLKWVTTCHPSPDKGSMTIRFREI